MANTFNLQLFLYIFLFTYIQLPLYTTSFHISLRLGRNTKFHYASIAGQKLHASTAGLSKWKSTSQTTTASSSSSSPTPPSTDFNSDPSAKTLTKEIMKYFSVAKRSREEDKQFSQLLQSTTALQFMDGLHILTLMFQCARMKRRIATFLPVSIVSERLQGWNKAWTERDVFSFAYGIRSLECIDDAIESNLIKFAATKIQESNGVLSSRAIGNALYGMRDLTSDFPGIADLCQVLAEKIATSTETLTGLDIGIGLYGLQGISATRPETRTLIHTISMKIASSDSEFDTQALSNALYGLQSMTSEYEEVRQLVKVLAKKVSESQTELCAQAIGSALFGLQRLSSDSLEVRSLLAALAEKVETSTTGLDAQAIGNALFGLQRMQSNNPELRALIQALATKMVMLEVQLDAKAIASALYGLRSMSSDSLQVRSLLAALADRISISKCSLNGNQIAESLFGLSEMYADGPELRALLASLAEKIDVDNDGNSNNGNAANDNTGNNPSSVNDGGSMTAQDIGNALYGLKGMSSEMFEVRVIMAKLATKIKKASNKVFLGPQHIGRALFGLQRCQAQSVEVKSLLKQLTDRIAKSTRIKLTAEAIASALFGLQGMTSDVVEVQELLRELAKKISASNVEMSSDQLGRALFGLQSLSSRGSLFEESAIGIDADEVLFLLSTLWDKMKNRKESMPLSSITMGLQGIALLRDPVANNMRQYMYSQLVRAPTSSPEGIATTSDTSTNSMVTISSEDIINIVRVLCLNQLTIPKWIAEKYLVLEESHRNTPVLAMSKADKAIIQRYQSQYPVEGNDLWTNHLLDGFRLDLFSSALQLNIELDGPTHRYPARANADRLRDEYLMKKGIQVHRITLFGRNVSDLVQEIHRIVSARREQVEDRQIQQLYQKR